MNSKYMVKSAGDSTYKRVTSEYLRDKGSDCTMNSPRSISRQSELKKQNDDVDKIKSQFDLKTEKEKNAN